MRAAEYVRVSTDLQEYSIINQQAAIADYAAQRNLEIVKTYSDPAKSGLDIKHRPGLQRLIDDVVGGRADFQAVLVYDVSRWGRFQDCDEAACYEFLCRRAGLTVHYCAEPFPNDGSSSSTDLKMLKRMMAAEYLRELSARVIVGQSRIAANGFKLGGTALFGLRRMLLGPDGKPKMVLQDGDQKSLTTDRVTCVMGPEHEVEVVREIYSMFLDQGVEIKKIAHMLNERGIKRGKWGPWDCQAIRQILTHPYYTGTAVFNRTSVRLGGKIVRNPPEKWTVCPNRFPAIISQERFERVQAKFGDLVNRRSNERLLAELKAYVETHENALPFRAGVQVPGLASYTTYRTRFGGWAAVYRLLNYDGCSYTEESTKSRRTLVALKSGVIGQLREALAKAGIRATEGRDSFQIRGRGCFLVETGRSYILASGLQRWTVKSSRLRRNCSVIMIRLQPGNEAVKDLLLFHRFPRKSCYRITDELAAQGTCHQTAEEVAEAIHAPTSNPDIAKTKHRRTGEAVRKRRQK